MITSPTGSVIYDIINRVLIVFSLLIYGQLHVYYGGNQMQAGGGSNIIDELDSFKYIIN